MGRGFFGSAFDFNHDGNLDAFEQAADFGMFMNMMEESEKDNALSSAGLDRTSLEYMDDDERRAVLEDAGLDPDDFGF